MAGCLHQQPGESALPASPVRSCRPGGAVGQAAAHTPHQSGEECVLKSKRREEKTFRWSLTVRYPLIVRRRRSSRADMMLSPCLLRGEMPLWHTVSSRAQGVGISPDRGFGRPEEPRMAPFHPPLSPGYHYLGFLG